MRKSGKLCLPVTLVVLQIIERPSVPVDSFQPASQQASYIDRGSDLLIPLLHLFA